MGETTSLLALVDADRLADKGPLQTGLTKLRELRGQAKQLLAAAPRKRRAIVARLLARQAERARMRLHRGGPSADMWLPDAELSATLVATLRKAGKDYRGGVYHGGASYFEAMESVSPGGARRWEQWIRGPIEVVAIPGTHESCVHEPNIGILARKLRSRLHQLDPANPSPAL